MLNRQGIFAITAIVIVFAALHLGLAGDGFDPSIAIPTLFGGTAFILMSVSMVLATRAAFLERLFGGLDRMYQVHKMTGILSLLFVLAHFFLAPKELPAGVDPVAQSLTPSAPMGMFAMVVLILSLVIALNRKISYSRWRPFHKAMGIAYALVFAHFMLIPEVFRGAFGPSYPLLVLCGVVGMLAFIYSVARMNRRTAIDYVVEQVNPMERATELVLAPTGRAMGFRPGQFAFLELQGKGWDEAHPFTLSSAPGDDRLRFTIKVLGDWTRKVRDELEAGGKALVRGPYGYFDMAKAGPRQVWIAGGIGLTPFLSALRDMKPGDAREIVLVYAARNANEAIFLAELQERANALGNVRIIERYSDQGEFADVDLLNTELTDPLSDYEFFLCGPKPMVDSLDKSLKGAGVGRGRIHREVFEFR